MTKETEILLLKVACQQLWEYTPHSALVGTAECGDPELHREICQRIEELEKSNAS